MTHTTRKIKHIARKYLAPVVLGAALTFGGCNKEADLPVDQNAYQAQSQRLKAEKIKYKQQMEAIAQAREKKVLPIIESYHYQIKEAVDLFNKSIEDGKYTLEEQNNTLNKFKLANKSIEAITSYDPNREYLDWFYDPKFNTTHICDIKDSRLMLSIYEQNLNSLLRKNLEQIDLGTPELEKQLRKQGLEVSVENTFSETAQAIAIVSLLLTGIVGFFYFNNKHSEKDPEAYY